MYIIPDRLVFECVNNFVGFKQTRKAFSCSASLKNSHIVWNFNELIFLKYDLVYATSCTSGNKCKRFIYIYAVCHCTFTTSVEDIVM